MLPLDNLNMWIVPALLYLKVRTIFAMWPVHLYGEKFIFSVTTQYVVHMLKLQSHYASFGKFMRIVADSKVMVILALP